MGRLIVTEFVSADGVIEDPQNWHLPSFVVSPDAQEVKSQEALTAGGLLFGRRTYEIMAGAWPARGRDMAGEPEPTRETHPETFFEDRFNWLPKWVVTDSLTEATWNNSSIVRGEGLAEAIAGIKAELGEKPLYLQGSATLVSALLPLGVIDEVHLLVHPVWVGAGKRVFDPAAGTVWLERLGGHVLTGGITYLRYAITDEPEMPSFA